MALDGTLGENFALKVFRHFPGCHMASFWRPCYQGYWQSRVSCDHCILLGVSWGLKGFTGTVGMWKDLMIK